MELGSHGRSHFKLLEKGTTVVLVSVGARHPQRLLCASTSLARSWPPMLQGVCSIASHGRHSTPLTPTPASFHALQLTPTQANTPHYHLQTTAAWSTQRGPAWSTISTIDVLEEVGLLRTANLLSPIKLPNLSLSDKGRPRKRVSASDSQRAKGFLEDIHAGMNSPLPNSPMS